MEGASILLTLKRERKGELFMRLFATVACFNPPIIHFCMKSLPRTKWKNGAGLLDGAFRSLHRAAQWRSEGVQ